MPIEQLRGYDTNRMAILVKTKCVFQISLMVYK